MDCTRIGASDKPLRPSGGLTGYPEDGDLASRIRSEQEALAGIETATVVSLIAIASLVAKVKPGRAGKWPPAIVELGYTRRVACRLRAMGRALGDEDGSAAPDLAGAMPGNVSKLVQLARLTPKQLREVLTALDCRKATLKAVKAAVDAVLGVEPRRGAAGVAFVETLAADHQGAPRSAFADELLVDRSGETPAQRLTRLMAAHRADRAAGGGHRTL